MAFIDGLWSLGSSVLNSVSQHQTNQANDQRQQRQNEYNFRMWELNNQYNDPSSQMKRLERAGLNPNLIYGQNAQGASGLSSSPAQGVNPFQAQSPVQTDPLMLAQLELIRKQAYKADMEGQGQDIQNQILDATGFEQALANLGYTQQQIVQSKEQVNHWHVLQDQIRKNMEETDANINLINEKVREVQASVNLLDKKALTEEVSRMTQEELKNLYILQQAGLKLDNEAKEIINKNLPQQIRSEIAENWANVKLANEKANTELSVQAYNEAGTIYTKQQTETEKKRGKNIDADTREKNSKAALNEIDKKTRNAQNVANITESASKTAKNTSDAVANFVPFGKNK